VGDLLAEIRLSGFLHLGEYHAADFSGYEVLEIMFVLDLNGRLSTLVDEFEWPVFLISLDVCIIEVATNQTDLNTPQKLLLYTAISQLKKELMLGIEDGVLWVALECVFCRVANQTLVLGKRNPGRRDTAALKIGNNVNAAFSLNTSTRVGCSKVNTDDGAIVVVVLGSHGEQVMGSEMRRMR